MPSLELVGNGVDINNQGITSVTWQKTGGTGTLRAFTNDYSAYATGYGSNWYVNGKATITNSCGATVINFTLAPDFQTDPCSELLLKKTGSNLYRLIDPCDPQTILRVNSSELYSQYGYKIKDLKSHEDTIEIDAEPGTIKIIKAETNGKSVAKMIITD